MGELMPLGKAFAIIAVMTHGPDLPTELSMHNERHRIFMAAAQYALSEEDIATVLAHKDQDEKRIYYHNLLTTSCRPLNTLIYNASIFRRKCLHASVLMWSTSCIWGWESLKACLISK